MCVVSAKGVRHVRNAQNIQLLLGSTAGGIDRKEHWPGNQATDEADDRDNLEIAEQEVRIHRVMLQDIGIGEPVHVLDPANQASRGGRSELELAQGSQVGTRHISPLLAATQQDEEEDHGTRDSQVNHQRGHKTRSRIRSILSTVAVTLSWGQRACTIANATPGAMRFGDLVNSPRRHPEASLLDAKDCTTYLAPEEAIMNGHYALVVCLHLGSSNPKRLLRSQLVLLHSQLHAGIPPLSQSRLVGKEGREGGNRADDNIKGKNLRIR